MTYFNHNVLTQHASDTITAVFRVMILLKEYKDTNMASCVASVHYLKIVPTPCTYKDFKIRIKSAYTTTGCGGDGKIFR